jgi:biotin transport system substrate-specific component
MAETTFVQASSQAISAPRSGWRTPVAVLSATALVALCAHIAIPLGFTPVPITMQTFAVLLIGLLFSPRIAFVSLVVYLAEGAAGMPVFSPHGAGGVAQLLGPTGGYLLSYPFAAALASFLYRYARRGFFAASVAASFASILILLAGAIWLGMLTRTDFSKVFGLSVAPFLPGEIAKIAAAVACIGLFDTIRKPSRT